jgi:glycosyltransferase involved in cell wall biosynthesis
VVHTKHGNNPGGPARLAAQRLAAHWVDAFVAVSPETAATARRRHEVEERRLSVIQNGIALDRFRPDPRARARVRGELGIASEAWVVGTVGRVAEEKNQALLLRAMAPLLGTACHAVVVGDGPLLPSLRELAGSLAVASSVHLLGTRGDVPDVLNAFDVFVLCSDTEGLPLVIPEAMATGLAVVSTRVGGVPSVVEDGRTGLLVRAGDEEGLRTCLAGLHADRTACRRLGAAGLEAAGRFSAERMQREYAELYATALSGRRKAGPTIGPSERS